MIIQLQDAHRNSAAATLCDAGADTRRGNTQPGAWIAISIRSVGTVTPDADGHLLHAMVQFAPPGPDQRAGKRRMFVDKYRPAGVKINDPIEVYLDHGTGWVGTPAQVFLRGGTNGDTYDVTICQNVPRDETRPENVIDVYEEAFRFRLTSYFVVEEEGAFVAFPDAPDYHQWFYVIQGAARVAMPGGIYLPLTNYGPDAEIPLSAPPIQVASGIYVTRGEV